MEAKLNEWAEILDEIVRGQLPAEVKGDAAEIAAIDSKKETIADGQV